MRIAVVRRDYCYPKRCSLECIKFCPKVRSGEETVVLVEGIPVIQEELCVGCGICVHKCPFTAIEIINLADELEEELVHQYGKNDFRLFKLPTPKKGELIGLFGPNAIGKTTVIKILSGLLVPNLGDYEGTATWDKVLDRYSGTELCTYLEKLTQGQITVSLKPQYISQLGRVFNGTAGDLLNSIGTRRDAIKKLKLEPILPKDVGTLSGGELQLLAIAATLGRSREVYLLDEPCSYLDVEERLQVAKVLRDLAKKKTVMVIEHDLAVLDFLADKLHLMYGLEGAYGVVTNARPSRTGINIYLSGYLRAENIRFREKEIKFERRPPKRGWEYGTLLEFDKLEKRFDHFTLRTDRGILHQGEVVGVLGRNATGKTTFVRLLARDLIPDKGEVKQIKISYKPQYLEVKESGSVGDILKKSLGKVFSSKFFKLEIEKRISLERLYPKEIIELSGGELQRLAIALALGREADLYLFDEPSAYLDSNQRMICSKTIRKVMEARKKAALVVDHDIYFIDMIADSIMVFSGEPSRYGIGKGPYRMRDGMNVFLKKVNITFRRDPHSNRPRINKLGSRLDKEQKRSDEYYYT